MLEHFLTLARPWFEHYGIAVLFVTVFIEGFGIPAPGETFMIGGALLARQGELHLGAVTAVAWLAAVLGDNLGYVIGRLGGRHLLLRLRFPPAHLQKVEQRFRRYGIWLVAFARFFEVLRQLNGIVAGSLKMPWLRFLVFNALGASLWVLLWVGGVYFFSAWMADLLHAFGRLHDGVAVVSGLAAAGILVWLILRWRKQSASLPDKSPHDR
jgi:membrane protein DedA with SNARE-associated domain